MLTLTPGDEDSLSFYTDGAEILSDLPEEIRNRPQPDTEFVPLRLHTPEEYAMEGYVMTDNASAVTDQIAIAVKKTNDVRVIDESPFIEKGTHLFMKTKKGDEILLANFTVSFSRMVHKHTLHGEADYYDLILRKDSTELSITISTAGYFSLPSVLTKGNHSDFRIEPSVPNNLQYFRDYLSRIFELSKHTLQVAETYDYAGWQELENGQMHYFSALDEGCSDDRALIPIAGLPFATFQESVRWLFHLQKLGDPIVMMPMFLYKFAGILAAPFAKAMHPIEFILTICGPSGIGKTTVSRPFFGDFDPELNMTNFSATSSGIERFIQSKHDGIALLDDLSSITDRESLRTLERVLRQFCDSNGRITAARDGGYTRTMMRGGIVLTSETPLEGSRQSSILRLLHVPATYASFDERLVPILQADALNRRMSEPDNYSKMDVAMTAFVAFVTDRYNEIVRGVVNHTPDLISVKFRRLQTVYTMFHLIDEVVCEFGDQYGVFSDEEKCHHRQTLQNALLSVINYNSLLGQQSDPMMLFLNTIVPDIKQNLLRVASTKEEFAGQMTGFVGYFDTEDGRKKLKVDPQRVFEWVIQRFRKSSFHFTATLQELLKKLLDAGLSEGYAQKGHAAKTLKQVTIDGKKLPLLVLRWDEVLTVVENS